jgi:hypothetical protein
MHSSFLKVLFLHIPYTLNLTNNQLASLRPSDILRIQVKTLKNAILE